MFKKIMYFVMVAVAAISFTSCACTVIDNSEVGIKFNKFSLSEQGKLEAEPVTGYIFYNPFKQSVFKYPVFVQRVDYDPFVINTKDGAVFHMDPVLAYYIIRDKATDVFSTYRKTLPEIESGYMRTCIYDAYRITANKYNADELMSNRAEFEADVRIMLDKSLGDEGFYVKEFTSQIDPPESLRRMIDAKNEA